VGTAYYFGRQQALHQLKLAAYDPWQIEVAQRHYPQLFDPGLSPDVGMSRLQEAMRARALSAQDPTAALALRGRTPTPVSTTAWETGTAEPISRAQLDFLRRLEGGTIAPLPREQPTRPVGAVPEPPHTPMHSRGDFMRPRTLNVSNSMIIEPPKGVTGLIEKAPAALESATSAEIPALLRRAATVVARAR
jgi:hypothetical protein